MNGSEQAPSLRQSTCVAIDGRAILIEGAPGTGKSSLALALIDRGAVLIGDDGVTLELRESRLWASPPPNISGRLEIRGIGLVEMPVTSAPVDLLLTLDGDVPRYVEQAGTTQILGETIPTLAFFTDSPVAAMRAEFALRQHGLATSGTG